jgi:hypothetical protein
MKQHLLFAVATTALLAATAPLSTAEVEPGCTSLFDGETFDGWKPAEQN